MPTKDSRLEIRVTADERKNILANAAALGMNISEYTRFLLTVLAKKVKVVIKDGE